MVQFSLVLPVHNQGYFLKRNLPIIKRKLDKLGIDYEIIIAEDGSTDQSYKIAKEFEKKYKNVKVLHSRNRLGRGLALKRAFKAAKGICVGYIDIDNATNLRHLKDLIELIGGDYDIVVGSRYLKKKFTERSFIRLILSLFFNFLVRIVLESKIKDHQCGFKAFKKDVINRLNKFSEDGYWFWDTEILALAQSFNFKIKEFPVEWKENKKSTVNIIKDSLYMLTRIFKLRMKLSKMKREFQQSLK